MFLMSSPTSTTSTNTLLLLLALLLALVPNIYHLSTRPRPPAPTTMWFQKQLTLPAASRGSYLVTDRITSQLPEIAEYRVGLLHLFVQHTSCALSLNENWDDDVREDMTDALERIAPYEGPKGQELYRHNAEGKDDMPVGPFCPSVGPMGEKRRVEGGCRCDGYLTGTGTHQVVAHRRERHHPHQGRPPREFFPLLKHSTPFPARRHLLIPLTP